MIQQKKVSSELMNTEPETLNIHSITQKCIIYTAVVVVVVGSEHQNTHRDGNSQLGFRKNRNDVRERRQTQKQGQNVSPSSSTAVRDQGDTTRSTEISRTSRVPAGGAPCCPRGDADAQREPLVLGRLKLSVFQVANGDGGTIKEPSDITGMKAGQGRRCLYALPKAKNIK